jgi:hypothetical protein
VWTVIFKAFRFELAAGRAIQISEIPIVLQDWQGNPFQGLWQTLSAKISIFSMPNLMLKAKIYPIKYRINHLPLNFWDSS